MTTFLYPERNLRKYVNLLSLNLKVPAAILVTISFCSQIARGHRSLMFIRPLCTTYILCRIELKRRV